MRRLLTVIVTALLVAGTFSPAHADSTVVVHGLDTPAPFFPAITNCDGSGGVDPSVVHLALTKANPTPTLGTRSLKVTRDTPTLFGFGRSGNSSHVADAFSIKMFSDWAQAGTAVIYITPADTASGYYWVGYGDTGSIPPGSWWTVDATTVSYFWTLYNPDNQPTSTTGTGTLASFVAAHGEGHTDAILGFGCVGDGPAVTIDGFRAGPSGNATTLNIEQQLSSLSISRTPSTITAGGSSTIRGRINVGGGPAGGASVKLDAKPFGSSTWTNIATVTSAEDGSLAKVVKPVKNTAYRWRFVETTATKGSVSSSVSVGVKTKVTATIVDATLHVGQNLVAKGTTFPRKAGVAITLWRKTSTGNVVLARGTTHSDGTYKIAYPVNRKGTWTVFVTVAAASGNLAGTSPSRSATVS